MTTRRLPDLTDHEIRRRRPVKALWGTATDQERREHNYRVAQMNNTVLFVTCVVSAVAVLLAGVFLTFAI